MIKECNKGNISDDANHLGSLKGEKKLDVKEESYQNSNKRPYDCIRKSLCRDRAVKQPGDVYQVCTWLCD